MSTRHLSADGLDYVSDWSERDQKYVVTVRQFPSLSVSALTESEAFNMLREIAQQIRDSWANRQVTSSSR